MTTIRPIVLMLPGLVSPMDTVKVDSIMGHGLMYWLMGCPL